MTLPPNLKIDIVVKASRTGAAGQTISFRPKITTEHRPGGMTMYLDWPSESTADQAAGAASADGAPADEPVCVELAREWLEERLQEWKLRK